jgi:phosphate transport system substrate-binding protein
MNTRQFKRPLILLNIFGMSRRTALWTLMMFLCGLGMTEVRAEDVPQRNGFSMPTAGSHEEMSAVSPDPQGPRSLIMVVDPSWRPYLAGAVRQFHHVYPHYKIILQDTPRKIAGSEIDTFLKDIAEVRHGDGHNTGPDGPNTIKLLALSRSLTPKEQEACRSRFGYVPLSLVVGKDAVVLYVNRANPIREVTLEQVQGMFSHLAAGSDVSPIIEWGGVGGQGNWARFPIHLYGEKRADHISSAVFRQLVLQGRGWHEALKDADGPASMVLNVANDPFGIGFGPLGYAIPQVRVLPIAKKPGLPAIRPSEETVANGTYPLSRSLYLHVHKIPNKDLSSPLPEFLGFLHSPEGQNLLVSRGTFPLDEFEIAKNIRILKLAPEWLTAGQGGGRASSGVVYR